MHLLIIQSPHSPLPRGNPCGETIIAYLSMESYVCVRIFEYFVVPIQQLLYYIYYVLTLQK